MVEMTDSFRENGFTAYMIESACTRTDYRGRDAYYKILLISAVGEIEYDNACYQINGPVLVFAKPAIRCRWSLSTPYRSTYICAFDSDFLQSECLRWSERCDTFLSATPVFHLNTEQENFVRAIFSRMVEEQNSSYTFKVELIQNQLCILKHRALQMTAAKKSACSTASVMPSCVISLELVEMGFPGAAQALHSN